MHRQRPHFARLWHYTVAVPYRQILLTEHPAFGKFFGDRCPHLSGMIAYFAVLSMIPASFLFVSALALAGALSTQGYIVTQLQYVLPESSVNTLVATVDALRERKGSLGLIGGFGLVWGTLNFFSSIESALNIIYGVENRRFLKQKLWVLFLVSVALIFMVATIVLASFAFPLLQDANRYVPVVIRLTSFDALLSLLLSMGGAFLFLLSVYRFLPNTDVHVRDVWIGALGGALVFEITVHVLPLYLYGSSDVFLLKAFAGALITLIWFYLVANILLAGAAFNWWWGVRRGRVTTGLLPGMELDRIVERADV